MRKLSPILIAALLVAASLSGCAGLRQKSATDAPPQPLIGIRHSEALNEQIQPQQTLAFAFQLGDVLDADPGAARRLQGALAERLEHHGVRAVFADMGDDGQPDLRAFARNEQSAYLVTMFGGTGVVLRERATLASGELVANIFEVANATPLWAGLLHLTGPASQAEPLDIATALADTLASELARIGALPPAQAHAARAEAVAGDYAGGGLDATPPETQHELPADAPPPAAAEDSAAPSAAASEDATAPPPRATHSTATVPPVLTLALRPFGGDLAATPVALRLVRIDGEMALTLESRFKLALSHEVLRNPHRLAVDFAGVDVAQPGPFQVADDIAGHPLVASVRASRYQPDVVRLVLDLKSAIRAVTLPAMRDGDGATIHAIALVPR